MRNLKNPSPKRRTVTLAEAADILGISRTTAYKAAERGEIPTITFGKRLVVPRAALDKMLAEAMEGSPEEAA